ncbi:MAG: GAF domain-containing protein [Candidatus Omnitrophica bacterium]|nr:GAF domain-containing protein [Candidatus Omnitrophota bacterium]
MNAGPDRKKNRKRPPQSADFGRLEELSALHEISKSMQTLDLDAILHLILDGVTRAIGFDRTRLYLINEKDRTLECKMAVGVEHDKIIGINLPLDKEDSMVARAVIERQPFIVADALRDSRVNPRLKQLFGLKSFAVVPLVGRDKVLGIITADNLFSDRSISAEKFESLITFANQAGLAIENAKMYEELRSFSRTLEDRVKEATRRLQETQDKLIESEKLAAMGKLSAGIAHEIRNPLTSIKVLVHSLGERLSEDSAKEDIRVVEEEIERVNQIISKFLDFSKPRQPSFSPVEVNQVVRETLSLIAVEAEERNIWLAEELNKLPEIEADKKQLKQVLLNLLLNAMQAMPEGGRLTVITSYHDTFIEITVSDEGAGIPDAIKEKLFEPFFTTREEGIGLGLSIVKRIVDEHDGYIAVKDNKPRGARFCIALPVKPGETT